MPSLSVSLNGGPPEKRVIDPWFSTYAFPVDRTGRVEVSLTLDQVQRVPGDPRDLGIIVRQVDLVVPASDAVPLEGWYEDEDTPYSVSSRWMKQSSTVLLPGGEMPRGADFILCCGLPRRDRRPLSLSVSAAGTDLGSARITPGGVREFCFPLEKRPLSGEIALVLDGDFDTAGDGDPRQLGMVVEGLRLVPRGEETPFHLEGWHGAELGERDRFRWSEQQAGLALPHRLLSGNRYLALTLASNFADGSQTFSLSLDGRPLAECPLFHEWFLYSVEHGVRVGEEERGSGGAAGPVYSNLLLTLNKTWSPPVGRKDDRRLGLKMMDVSFHDDETRHAASLVQLENAELNCREMTAGKIVLDSGPINLGVDLYGRCNMKPPCVYCTWDLSKNLEGDLAGAVVDAKTLEGYGPFFSGARNLINCSIGEPLLHPGIIDILELCERHNQVVDLSTNGQAFSSRTIRALAGKPIGLFISLDAASAETYARIRNDRWESVVTRLAELNEARRAHGNLPRVYMVFMPMKVNRHEIEDYFRLCRDTGADVFVLRPLNYIDRPEIRIERGGYLFDYEQELLSRAEIEAVIEQCGRLSRKYKMPLLNQFSFGQREEQG